MNRTTNMLAAATLAAAIALSACGGAAPAKQAATAVQLNASGATFPQPLYEDWAFAFNQADPSVTINYSGGGSGQGKKDIIAGTVDFAGSDARLTDDEYAKKPMQMIPTVAGAVVPIFNIQGITAPITLDGNTLGGIYAGRIETWSDPAIAALNPGIAFPNLAINVVHRSDGSGTTSIFTLYLTAASSDWKSAVNPSAGTTVDWPADRLKRGQGGKGNAGVAAAVQKTDGAIGYVELAYARNNAIPFARMVNAAGKTVEASIPSTVAAIKDAQFDARLAADIVNGKDARAWPIAGFTYLILNQDYSDCARAQKLVAFINWALTNSAAQDRAGKLLYAPLPATIVPKALDALKAITCQGKSIAQP